MKPKVLIMTASFGSGHVIAAKALAEAFEKKNITPEILDIVLQGGKQEQAVAKFYAFLMRHGHFVWKTYREKIMPIKKGDSIRKIYKILHKDKFIEKLGKINPDIIVSTMDTASVIASLYKEKHPEVKIYTVITDFVAHPLWVWKNMDGYFVGSNLAQEFLIEQGIEKEKIVISGIPLREKFEKKLDYKTVRKKLGIAEDKKVILISAGTYSSVSVEQITKAVSDNLLAYVIILAGSLEKNVIEYAGILKEYGVQGKVVSYADNMEEFMTASDLYISKAGGLTVAECFATGLPAVYVNNFPGHEQGNAEYAAYSGAAICLNSARDLKSTIQSLLHDSSKLQEMRTNALKIAKPQATSDIVRKILSF